MTRRPDVSWLAAMERNQSSITSAAVAEDIASLLEKLSGKKATAQQPMTGMAKQ
jgi:hypothetical protein